MSSDDKGSPEPSQTSTQPSDEDRLLEHAAAWLLLLQSDDGVMHIQAKKWRAKSSARHSAYRKVEEAWDLSISQTCKTDIADSLSELKRDVRDIFLLHRVGKLD